MIVALAGNPIQMDTRRFNMHIKLNYELGEDSPLSVLRNGQRKKIKIRLVE